MGILIDKRKDKQIYEDAIKEVNSIINTSKLDDNLTKVKTNKKNTDNTSEINNELTNKYTFYLPVLRKILEEKYPTFKIELIEDSIKIKDFPYGGVHLEIKGGIVITFYIPDKYEYDRIKVRAKRNIDYQLSDIRIYWNYLKIMAYQEKNYEVKISEKGLNDIINRVMRVVDIFFKELN